MGEKQSKGQSHDIEEAIKEGKVEVLRAAFEGKKKKPNQKKLNLSLALGTISECCKYLLLIHS